LVALLLQRDGLRDGMVVVDFEDYGALDFVGFSRELLFG
jgi:hypothetical protein